LKVLVFTNKKIPSLKTKLVFFGNIDVPIYNEIVIKEGIVEKVISKITDFEHNLIEITIDTADYSNIYGDCQYDEYKKLSTINAV
jgi:hypothetical protein